MNEDSGSCISLSLVDSDLSDPPSSSGENPASMNSIEPNCQTDVFSHRSGHDSLPKAEIKDAIDTAEEKSSQNEEDISFDDRSVVNDAAPSSNEVNYTHSENSREIIYPSIVSLTDNNVSNDAEILPTPCPVNNSDGKCVEILEPSSNAGAEGMSDGLSLCAPEIKDADIRLCEDDKSQSGSFNNVQRDDGMSSFVEPSNDDEFADTKVRSYDSGLDVNSLEFGEDVSLKLDEAACENTVLQNGDGFPPSSHDLYPQSGDVGQCVASNPTKVEMSKNEVKYHTSFNGENNFGFEGNENEPNQSDAREAMGLNNREPNAAVGREVLLDDNRSSRFAPKVCQHCGMVPSTASNDMSGLAFVQNEVIVDREENDVLSQKENVEASSASKSAPSVIVEDDEGEFIEATDIIESLVSTNSTWRSLEEQASNEDDNASDVDEIPCTAEFKSHKWANSSSSNRTAVGTGSWYEGDLNGGQMSGVGCLSSKDKHHYVNGMWQDNKLIELLSCQFVILGAEKRTIYMRKQANRYLLSIDEDEFVTRATTKSFQALDFTRPLSKIKHSFFDNVTITDVIEHKFQAERNSALVQFEKTLKNSASAAMESYDCAGVLMMLNKYSKENSAQVVLSAMGNDETIPADLRESSIVLLTCENLLFSKKLNLLKFASGVEPSKLNLRSIFLSVYEDNIKRHRQILVNKCPSSLPSLMTNISDLSKEKILYVSFRDIDMFKQLASLTNEPNLVLYFEHLQKSFFDELMTIRSFTPPTSVMPLTTPVYGFLFKSFLEIVTGIQREATNCTFENMLIFKNGHWKLIDEICWSQSGGNTTSKANLHRKSLECQYKFVFNLLEHYKPKLRSNAKKFDYTFHVLGKNEDESWLSRQFNRVKQMVGLKKHFTDLPDERLVWLFLLDNTMNKVFTDGKLLRERFNPLLEGHIEFLITAETDCFESFRVVTHSILKFMSQTMPYFEKTGHQSDDKDDNVLKKQMNYITEVSRDMGSNSLASNHFRDLINEYNRYWSVRQSLVSPKYLTHLISQLHQAVLKFVISSLEKCVSVPVLVSYLRSLNDFLEDFKDMDLLSMWYVKNEFYQSEGLEKVDNKLSSETCCSYRVTNVEKYVKKFGRSCPAPHFVIRILEGLLECANESLSKNWASYNLTESQLEGAGTILDAMRSSFLYFKEQPDYRDFELFTNESIEPFKRVVASCRNLKEFKTRVGIVKESFWYIRKMDEIGVEAAVTLLKRDNTCYIDGDKLKMCYDLYLKQYERYIEETVAKSHEDGINFVKRAIDSSKTKYQKQVKEWNEEFKTVQIPTLLAGLSAIWSLMVSKDVSSTGKFLKPHCIQVLCILRLLSVESSQIGTNNHLAQVLTGQGKSVVLGLLSTILAFTGNRVRVLCYSEYLATRDQSDFKDFFRQLGVVDKITYGTFDNLANKFLNPTLQGKKTSLRSLVKSLILNQRGWDTLGSPSSDAGKTVLLIDEVDVFFSEDFYGNTYNSCERISIDGLPDVQEKIWALASGGSHERKALFGAIEQFIEDQVRSGNSNVKEYNKFRLKPNKFSILIDENGEVFSQEFSCRTLLEKHLIQMIDKAIDVVKGKPTDWFINTFKLIDEEVHKIKDDGHYSKHTFSGYYNTFNYFRLKESEFDHKNYHNYGYLIADTGVISYSKLPEEFPLILGVSGTLSNLCNHEREAIGSYSIDAFSILPSFFGDSNLSFDERENICVLNSTDWLSRISDRINAALKSQRSILVFFDTEIRLNHFQREYGNRYDRLNVLTENTSESLKVLFVNESGISNTVTLATRGMGRGVDFKSSVAVEKNGGVHVLQTFFSLDVKEETQIKGRTARKDNKGSYELVLCKDHLVEVKLLKKDESFLDYSRLHATRLELMRQKGETNAERIRKSEKKHEATMQFFGISTHK